MSVEDTGLLKTFVVYHRVMSLGGIAYNVRAAAWLCEHAPKAYLCESNPGLGSTVCLSKVSGHSGQVVEKSSSFSPH